MGEIPEDIWATVNGVVSRGYNVGLLDAVAAALWDERERCAKIAEDWGDAMDGPTGHGIAAAIRSESQ